MCKYISHISDYSQGLIFTYVRDINHIYDLYVNKAISKDVAFQTILRMFEYLKGYLYGLDVKHISKYIYQDNKAFDYLSFYNNSSMSVKYTLCLCPNFDNFCYKYTVINKGVKNVCK